MISRFLIIFFCVAAARADAQAPPPLQVHAPVLPMLIGSENVLAEITLRLEKKRTLSGIENTSDGSDLTFIDVAKKRHALAATLELNAGEHRFQMVGKIAADAVPLTIRRSARWPCFPMARSC